MTRMKESGIDWIGQIPEEWEIVKFKYLFNTSKGLSITKEYLVDEGIPVINYGQIHSSLTKQVQSCDVRLPFVPDYYLSKKGANLNQGDFVFADTSEDLEGAGNFSTRIDSTGPLLAGYHTIIARLNNYDEYDFRYFMHLFDSLAIRKQIQNKVSGIKVYSITQGILNSIFVIIPPKSEQQKIADFLDKKTAQLDKVKALLEEQIQKLKDYRASLIYETVTKGLDKTVPMKDSGIDWIGQVPEGWGVKPLKYLIKFKNGYAFDSKNITMEQTGVKVIRIGDFKSSGIDFNAALNVFTSFNSKLDFYRIRKSQILIAMSGATVGKISFVNQEPNVYSVINQRVGIIESEINKWIYYCLSTYSFMSYIQLNSNGSAQPNISSGEISDFKVAIPDDVVIQKCVKYLDNQLESINKLIQIKNQQIENINKQRQTLIYDYVTGKRRV